MPISSTTAISKGYFGAISGALASKVLFLPLYGVYVVDGTSYDVYMGSPTKAFAFYSIYHGLYTNPSGFYGISDGLTSKIICFLRYFPASIMNLNTCALYSIGCGAYGISYGL